MYLARITIWHIISIVIMIYSFRVRARSKSNSPIDDKNDPAFSEDYTDKLNQYLSDKKEIIIGVLGKKNIKKILIGEAPKEGICFLTDKASYFMGKVYRRKGGFIIKSNTHDRISNSELIGIKTIRLCSFQLFVLSVTTIVLIIRYLVWIFKLVAFYAVLNSYSFSTLERDFLFSLVILIPLIVCTICIIKVSKRSCVCIEYTGNTYVFPMNELGENEVRMFYKTISEIQMQDDYEKEESLPEEQNNEKILDGSQDKMRLLKEASEMYEKGLLGEDEFNKLKKEIIENN